MHLIADHLTVDRGGRRVLDGLAFFVSSGTALVVTGPNGTGKSTLLRTIAGLVHPSDGLVRLDGGDDDCPLAEQCHYFGHQDGLKTALSVAENLRFWQAFFGRSGAPAVPVAAALAEVGLDHLAELPAAYLSAGQRRRLALARLLVAYRPVWLLDEPTSALDAGAEVRFVDLVNRHLAKGGIVVAATHAPLGFTSVERLPLAVAGVA